MNKLSDDTLKFSAGFSAGLFSNAFSIPIDRFRIVVAQDSRLTLSLREHWRDVSARLSTAYTGGVARIGMKGTASTLNLLIPKELRERGPFFASFVTGFVFSPVLNSFRLLQIAKINGEAYRTAAWRLFATPSGLRTYAHNTALFAPGEALRMMMCFGTKDFLQPYFRADRLPAKSEAQVAGRAATLAVTIGPLVALVESVVSLATETASTVHAKLGAAQQGADVAALRAEAWGAASNPRYILRCLSTLGVKNVVGNTVTFFFMFASDEYVAFLRKRHCLRRRTSIEELLDLK